MGVLVSNLFNGPGNSDLEACAANHTFNFFLGKPGNAGRETAINKIRTALLRLGFSSADDGPGVYGPATTRAVLAFKSQPPMILGPGQRTPDAVVGRQTIVRLDEAIRRNGVDDAAPPPPAPLEFGSTDWRFSFFGNTSNSVFTLFISSIDLRDSKSFEIRPGNIDDSDLGEWRGSSVGTFSTSRKMLASDFQGSGCDVRLRKELGIGGSGLISGFISLRTPNTANPTLQVLPFADENLTADLRSGIWTLTSAQIIDPSVRFALVEQDAEAPSLSASAADADPGGSSGIRALRRHTFFSI